MLSVFQQGLRNHVLNFGLVSETLLAALVCYVPFANTAFGSRPISALHWLPARMFFLQVKLFLVSFD
jgi:sodium/potassium-transporting ATPase subunit alpha